MYSVPPAKPEKSIRKLRIMPILLVVLMSIVLGWIIGTLILPEFRLVWVVFMAISTLVEGVIGAMQQRLYSVRLTMLVALVSIVLGGLAWQFQVFGFNGFLVLTSLGLSQLLGNLSRGMVGRMKREA
ncbi:MAG: hypothetical protein KAX40_08220 [Herpetosiphon sp.]|nr:hypothetical protein [Herpetosiphon sp.]